MDSEGLYSITREQAELETSLEESHVKVKLEHAKITSTNEIPEADNRYCDESRENRLDPIEIKPVEELESQMMLFLLPKDMYVKTSMENSANQEKRCEGMECESVSVAEMRKLKREVIEDVSDGISFCWLLRWKYRNYGFIVRKSDNTYKTRRAGTGGL